MVKWQKAGNWTGEKISFAQAIKVDAFQSISSKHVHYKFPSSCQIRNTDIPKKKLCDQPPIRESCFSMISYFVSLSSTIYFTLCLANR